MIINEIEAYLTTVYGCLATADALEKIENDFSQYNPIEELVIGMDSCWEFPTFPHRDIATRKGNARYLMQGIPNYILALNNLKYQHRALYSPFDLVNVFKIADNNIKYPEDIVSYLNELYQKRDMDIEQFNNNYEQAAILAYQMYYKDGIKIPEKLNLDCIAKDYNEHYDENVDFHYYLSGATHSGFGSHCHNNQDYYKAVHHPIFNNICLMVVADGVGSYEYSDIVSEYFCKYIAKWFTNLKKINENTFAKELEIAIINADAAVADYCAEKGIKGATVASVAVIAPDKTYISSVGDTRAYLVKDGSLERVKRFESSYEERMAYGLPILEPIEISKIRPSGYIGYNDTDICNIDTKVFETKDIDGLILVTDGIYKETTDNELELIVNNCNPNDVAEEIVGLSAKGKVSNKYNDLLISHNQFVIDSDGFLRGQLQQGLDNATALYYQCPRIKKIGNKYVL